MVKSEKVFLKAINTALEMSENCIELLQKKHYEKALDVLDHRSRVVGVILRLNEQRLSHLNNKPTSKTFSNQLNQLIPELVVKDAEISDLLSDEKLLIQNEIAKTRKNKENFKGYNLNDLK